MCELNLRVIAKIKNDFPSKFGIPRQSGLVEVKSTIVFEKEYRDANALRGLEAFSHIWLIWGFSEVKADKWSPTVRPPRLGGNVRKGVFATRSPFRPNPIGLSAVRLESVENDGENGVVLRVSGADLMDGTPIYDIKPYLPLADLKVDASEGFSGEVKGRALRVKFSKELDNPLSEEKTEQLIAILAQDPRPSYISDDSRIYGFFFSVFEIRFTVQDDELTVISITKKQI